MSGNNRPLLIDALLILTLLCFLYPPIVFVFYRWNFVVERFFNQFSISYVPTWWSVVGFGYIRWTWSNLATEIWKGLYFTDKIINTSSVGLSKITTFDNPTEQVFIILHRSYFKMYLLFWLTACSQLYQWI
jgi:hypothetical protein